MGFFKKLGKTFKKTAPFIAAPFTGGASLALGQAGKLKGLFGGGGGGSPGDPLADPNSAESSLKALRERGAGLDPSIDKYESSIAGQEAPLGEEAAALRQRGDALGTLDPADFERRFQPALQRLMQSYGDVNRGVSERMEARGIGHRGSFAAGEKNVGESGPEGYEQSLVARELGGELNRAMMEAQGQSQAQRLGEYSARLNEPQIALARARLGIESRGAVPRMRTEAYSARVPEAEIPAKISEGAAGRAQEEKMYKKQRQERYINAALGAGTGALASMFCCARGSLIETPGGQTKIEDLQIGDWVLSIDGGPVKVTATTRKKVPPDHIIHRVVLDDNREMIVSPSHPLVAGFVGDLNIGDVVDGASVVLINAIPYADGMTYDIKTLGPLGGYLLNGIPLATTIGG